MSHGGSRVGEATRVRSAACQDAAAQGSVASRARADTVSGDVLCHAASPARTGRVCVVRVGLHPLPARRQAGRRRLQGISRVGLAKPSRNECE